MLLLQARHGLVVSLFRLCYVRLLTPCMRSQVYRCGAVPAFVFIQLGFIVGCIAISSTGQQISNARAVHVSKRFWKSFKNLRTGTSYVGRLLFTSIWGYHS
jgi:hypothetical protein